MESFHLNVKFPVFIKFKEYNPDLKTLSTVKFCPGSIVSVGLSKVVQIDETVSFFRTKLPVSSNEALVIPWLAVLDCQTRELVDPLTSRRLPSERKERVAVESVTAESPPAFQMGIPLIVMAAKKVFC